MLTKVKYGIGYKDQELNSLRIVFFTAGVVSPVTTYIWGHFNTNNYHSTFMGWLMMVLFFTLIILSFTSILVNKHFYLISFVMFTLSSMSALYFAAINSFNYSYTLLFFFVLFATTMFLRKSIHLLFFHIFIFAQLVFATFYFRIENNSKVVVLCTYIILAITTLIYSNLIQKKQERINILVSLIENINQSYSFKEVLKFIHTSFASFIPYAYIGIALVKENGTVLEASYGISDGTIEGLPQNLFGLKVKLSDTSLLEVIKTGKAKVINDLEKYAFDRELKDYTKIIMKAGIISSISLPLIISNKPVGIIFFSSKNKNSYTGEHVKFLKTMASSISISFEKCILLEDLIYSNIMSLVKLTELRDCTTGMHLDRIKSCARLIAQKLAEDSIYKNEISAEYINNLEKFAPMHDIGKVGIRDGILQKPGKLTESEFEEMKRHTVYGGEVLKIAGSNVLRDEKSLFRMGIEIVEGHHEKWDGSGYPYGKSGAEIPLSARIVAVADVFDALTNERPYKKAFSFETSFQTILKGSGKHFDPEIVRIFKMNKSEIFDIYNL